MLMLSATNANVLFVPGRSETFSLYQESTDGSQVYLMGCTGQQQDIYDEYDVPADEVTIDVEAGEQPGEVVVQMTGTWNEYDENYEPTGKSHAASSTFTLVH